MALKSCLNFKTDDDTTEILTEQFNKFNVLIIF